MEKMSESGGRAPKSEKRQFKAEVRQVLDIVIHSLYTHREIFIRELISNASDALEKLRHEILTTDSYNDKDAPLEIRIETDKNDHFLTITDTGIGMTHDEIVQNLGTIARSGTKEFLENLKDRESLDSDIIGKFGVGFYSAFMAADEVRVRTRSYKTNASGYEWVSDGVGEYSINKMDNLPRGTSIILKLRDDAREFENEDTIKNAIRKYSNFVPFPINVAGERVNTVQAIWQKSATEVTDDEYREFFKFISNTGDEPLSRLHLSSDAPIQLSALLYIPAVNIEQFGFMKLKSSVNLYCRKILIQQHAENLLPDYLRFVTGVVDSADLPLNISRETLQDSLIFRKMSKFLTKRIIRHLDDEAKSDSEKYGKVWSTFGMFIKEGVTADFENRTDLARLLRYRSSATEGDAYTSLDEYIGRMREDQKEIYYINGRSREAIESGPYVGAFRNRGIEVLYLFEPVDDFVMASLGEYDGKKLVSADSADIELSESDTDNDMKKELSDDDVKNLAEWMKDTIGERVQDVRESHRLMDRPAIVVNPDSGLTTTMQKVMKAAGRDFGMNSEKILEINPNHPLIVTLKKLRDGDADKGFLQTCVLQIFDSALAEAGLLDDPREMVDRIYGIMSRALEGNI